MNEAVVESIIGGADGPTSVFIGAEVGMGALAASAAVGLLICFFGLKLVKMLTVLVGFLTGAGLGAGAAMTIDADGITLAIIVLACGIILAAVSFFFYRAGAFFVVFSGSVGVLSLIIGLPASNVMLAAIAGLSLILGILAAVFIEPVVIVVTAVSGGMSAGIVIPQIAGIEGLPWLGYAIGAALAVIGICIQFVMHSRKIGKKEKIQADKIKEMDSMESEVEKARTILEEDDMDEDMDEDSDSNYGAYGGDKDIEIVSLDDAGEGEKP